MCKKQRNKKQRPPLQPRQGQYKSITACSLKPSNEQIITIMLMIIIIILHSVFIINPVLAIANSILYILFSFHYVLLIVIIIYYIRITIFDPVDRCLLDQSFKYKQKQRINVKYCQLCRSDVMIRSYHCKRCNRCTQCFDHHCLYLNSCIGRRNYEMFIGILIMFILFNLNTIGQSIWVFVMIYQLGQDKTNSLSRWGIIPLIVICFCTFVACLVLCGFHLHISCCLDVTTLQLIQSEDTNLNRQNQKRKSNNINLQTANNLVTNNYL